MTTAAPPKLVRCKRKLTIPGDGNRGTVTLTCMLEQHNTDTLHRDRMIIFLRYGQTRDVIVEWRELGIASPRILTQPKPSKRQVRSITA